MADEPERRDTGDDDADYEDEDAQTVHDQIEENRDDTTSREAYELEMEDEGRSDAAGDVGDHID